MTNQKTIAYLFPGQGAQYVGMGQDVYDAHQEARDVYDLANDVFGFDIKKICFKGPVENLQQTRFAQPAIFTTSMAFLKVFEAKFKPQGAEVKAAAGLSLGEATALTAAGVFDLKNGLAFVRDRGLFMDQASIESPGSSPGCRSRCSG